MATAAYEWGKSKRKGDSRKLITPAPPSKDGSAVVHTWTSYRGKYVVQGEEKRLYRCAECQRIKEHSEGTYLVPSLRMANVGIAGERLEVDPVTLLAKHYCKPLRRSHVVGDQLYLEQREVVSKSGKRAMRAHMDALQTVETSRFALATEIERNEAKDWMANERSRKRGYQRARKDKYPVVASIAEIPNELTMPWSSRFALEGDASYGHTYLIFQDDTPGHEMAVFASPDNLEKLHRSAHWVSDGNFKYRPKDMQQLYTVHSFVETPAGQKEAKILVAAIMKTRTREVYERLFGVIHAQLMERFRTVGRMAEGGRAHFDFEPAAIGAFESVFGADLSSVCLLHYANYVNKKLRDLGLSTTYQECWTVNQFVRKLVALCMLPANYVLKAFELVCIVPSDLDGNENCECRDTPHPPLLLGTEGKLEGLRAYFEKNWLHNRYGVNSWNYHLMGGPRTTNHAEAWHSSLRSKFDGMAIDLGVWLCNFQAIHHQEGERTRQLVEGLVEPYGPRPAYLQNDARILAASNDIAAYLQDWSLRRVNRSAAARRRHDALFVEGVDPFLRSMGYLIGCKNMGEPPRHRMQPEDFD
uniref:MULE transposase domain-containing protein n=1 Tax=Plectus sambesii TaxID=2011161 RepID=A0A914XFB3_9BILA